MSLWPAFRHRGLAIDYRLLTYNPCDDVIFPSVIRAADHLDRPLATWYLYYAPHNAPGGVCLAMADSLAGPWREHPGNPLIGRDWPPHYTVSHVSSPHVVWDPEAGRFLLYFHGENRTTRVASSADGLHFAYEGVAIDTSRFDHVSECSYARVFRHGLPGKDNRWIILCMGNNQGTRRIYLGWSTDGIAWETRRTPLLSPPPGTGVTQIGAPWYRRFGGRHCIVFHGDRTPPDLSDLTTDLYVADVGPHFDREEHLGCLLAREAVSASNRRVADPMFASDNGTDYLFYSIGERLHQHLAYATQET